MHGAEPAEFGIVQTALDDEAAARELAAAIVEARLAACVQLVPITSLYRWEGRVREARETLLLAKTTAAAAEGLMDFIQSRHGYDVPEILYTAIEAGSKRYLEWVTSETQTPKQGG